MIEQINEQIDVLAFFSQHGKLIPRKFRWRKRIYDVTEVHQVHHAKNGTALLSFFHCSDGQSPYRKLCFNNVTKIWTLEETETDPEV